MERTEKQHYEIEKKCKIEFSSILKRFFNLIREPKTKKKKNHWIVFFFIVDCLLLPQLWKWNMKYWNHRRVVDSYYFKVNFFLYIIFYVWVQTTPLACQNIIFHSSHRSHGLRIDCSSTIWIQIWNPFFPKALSLFLSTSNCILFLNFFLMFQNFRFSPFFIKCSF